MGDYYEELLEGLKPLPGTVSWLLEQGKLGREEILYQQEYTWDPLTGMRERSVRCICTACGETWYNRKTYVGSGCSHGYAPAPFGFLTMEGEPAYHGKKTSCPACGQEARAAYTGDERNDEHFMCCCQVTEVRRLEDKLVLAEWNMRKVCSKTGNTRIAPQPRTAFVLEEKTMVRMSGQHRNMGGWSYYKDFRRRKQWLDDMAECPYIAPWDPALLVGTEGENSKLDLYLSATAGDGCYPVSYLKAWQKHRNLENLLTAGMGRLVGEMIREEFRQHSGYMNNCCRRTLELKDINFKEKRPSRMLGLDTATFREAAGTWDLRTLRAWRWLQDCGEAYTLPEDLDTARKRWDERETIRNLGLPALKTMRYLERQKQTATYLRDYHQMAREAGWDMDVERIRWPKDLRAAHDQAMMVKEFQKNEETQRGFERILERYGALEWSDGKICIRLPRVNSDLVLEGERLQHCVGHYGKEHTEGKIIFFVRHARRPERSWYTLNEDLTGDRPRRIQLHGYGNEWSGNKKLRIPREVLDFVARWEREVLGPFWEKELKRRKKEQKEKKTA